MVFGTYDIFHEGHKHFFRQARKHGGFLIVVVARDATVRSVKGNAPRNDERTRGRIIRQSRLADKVILGSLHDKYSAIKKYRPDIICLGYDQEKFIPELDDELQAAGLGKTRVIRLKAFKPEVYKSSKMLLSKKSPIKTWYVYILECSDGTFYTGITNDLKRRLYEHDYTSLGAKYTRARRPVVLAYSKRYPDRSSAAKAEAAIKNLSRQKKSALIIG